MHFFTYLVFVPTLGRNPVGTKPKKFSLNMNKKILFLILLVVLLSPSVILAQLRDWGSGANLNGLISATLFVVWVVFGLIVVLCFVVAGVMFLTANGQPEKIKTAQSAVIWGVVGVIVGIVAYSAERMIERLL